MSSSEAASRLGNRVAVIVPTYQRADLVERALLSVQRQSHPADEVVVVDDGSTDGTAERIAKRFPKIAVVRQENRGVSAARNRGIRESTAPWVAFLDADDEWTEEKLERQLAAVMRSHRLVCHCDEIWIRDGRRVNAGERHRKRGGWIYRECLPLCAISPSAAMIHRTVLERVGLFDETLPVCEDYDLWLRITASFPVELVDEALVVKYGGHADQLSRSTWGMDRYRIRALARAWRELELAPGERRATLETLLAKLEVVLGGALKRDHRALVEELEAQREHFAHLLMLENLNP